jgi:ribose 5-phosphate isomerase B
MKIAFGCDHAAIDIKNEIVKQLLKKGLEVSDFGCNDPAGCDYPDIARRVAELVSSGKCEKGILLCGTGVGMSIAANKFPHVRAGVCWNDEVASLVAEHNNVNVLCLPARFAGLEDIMRWIGIWLSTPFSSNERHSRRVSKISDIEKEVLGC